jgi:flagellar hook-associated protein 1 FlgK
MSDLLSLLSLGSAGIAAQNTGVSVAANNVANVNTAGYSRQRVDLESLVGVPLVGGVRSGDPDRLQNVLLGARMRTASGTLSLSRAFHEAVLDVEARLSSGGATVHEQLGTVFNRIAQVSASPTERGGRDAVVAAVRELVAGINRRAAEMVAARAEANQGIRDHAAQATEIAKRLADANTSVARTGDPVMKDERDRLATQLSELVGGSARIDRDGHMRFVLEGGAVLVDGGRAASLEATPDPATTDVKLAVVDGGIERDVAPTGGKIGADLAVRDTTIAGATAQLDQLAFDITNSFNTTHAANAGLDGVGGRNMFVALGGVAGAARAIAIDPALDADSTLLATSSGGGPGDNRGALALFGLGSATVASGGRTLGGAALDVVSQVGTRAATAKADVERDEVVSAHLASLRDSLAGVDLQEEMTNLARFEHASSAMTRFVSTIDGLLGDLIDRL